MILLTVATLAALLPFSGKAFHVDDPLFVRCARQVLVAPGDPYGFSVNWYGTSSPMAEVMRNPPLHAYLLAGAGAAFGFSERALHLALLLPAVAAVLATGALARALGGRPVLAGLLLLVSPGFLVSATSVMCDVTMLAFALLGVLAWVRGIPGGRAGALLLSGFLLAAAVLTKWNAVLFLPPLALHGLLVRRRPGVWLATLLLPVAAAAGFLAFAHARYGDAALRALALGAGGPDRPGPVAALTVLLVFAGGCALPALAAAPLVWGRRPFFVALAAVAAAAGVAALAGVAPDPRLAGEGGGRSIRLAQAGLFLFGGLSVLRLARPARPFRPSVEEALPGAWLLLTLAFALFLSWTASARYLLPGLPAAAILLSRAPGLSAAARRPALRAALILAPCAAISLAAAVADARLADSAREAAQRFAHYAPPPGGTVWFQGHWGFQHYMESAGGKALDAEGFAVRRGDFVVIPGNNPNTFPLDGRVFRLAREVEFPVLPWLSTMDRRAGAGFYASVWGPFPFLFARISPETYAVLVAHPP